jgi:hypothetical protein
MLRYRQTFTSKRQKNGSASREEDTIFNSNFSHLYTVFALGDAKISESVDRVHNEFFNGRRSRLELRLRFGSVTAHTPSEADNFDLQQYITRCYGSLTTINILFKNKDDRFRTIAADRPNA